MSFPRRIGAAGIKERPFVNLKFVACISALVATSGLALAQQCDSPLNGSKPTKADVQKVVQIVSSDKAKTHTYCDLNKLYDQMQKAAAKNDTKTVQALAKQANVLEVKLGPEYSKLMDGLGQVDPSSSEGKEFSSSLSALDKLCIK
jgi:hypothetical protein